MNRTAERSADPVRIAGESELHSVRDGNSATTSSTGTMAVRRVGTAWKSVPSGK
jgi:hypothetical protein